MTTSTHPMAVSTFQMESHPNYPTIFECAFKVRAKDFPAGISTGANAREPVDLNRKIYRDIRNNLEGKTSTTASFDLMHKGITILANTVDFAKNVRPEDRDKFIVDMVVNNQDGGIVDGAHTAKIIEETNAAGTTADNAYVRVIVYAGVPAEMISDIARGLNTGVQVAKQSIYNMYGSFDWIKDELSNEPYFSSIAWKESDHAEFDVRLIISLLETFNVFAYPGNKSHPIRAYTNKGLPLEKFANDYEMNEDDITGSQYYKLRGLLKGILYLYDLVRWDFPRIKGSGAGKMEMVENLPEGKPSFYFPFIGRSGKNRLRKGAAFPILGALRNYVEINAKTGYAQWGGGLANVEKAWKNGIGAALVEKTSKLATEDKIRQPDAIGKYKPHWKDMYDHVQMHIMSEQLKAASAKSGS